MKAVFLIHGFATDRDDFARIAPMLRTRYDEVVCHDLPNHGPHCEKEKIYFERIVGFVLAAFDEVKKRHEVVDVIGFSMGGALATMLSSVREVGRLILLAPANKYLAPFFLFSTVKRVGDVRSKQRHAEKLIDEPIISNQEIKDDFSDAVKIFFDRLLPKCTLRNVREFKKIIDHCNKSLGELCMPTLILWGKIDQLVPYASVKHIKSHCRHDATRVIIYPDVSHLMFHSRAHFRIADDIFRFLEDTEPPKLEYLH